MGTLKQSLLYRAENDISVILCGGKKRLYEVKKTKVSYIFLWYRGIQYLQHEIYIYVLIGAAAAACSSESEQ